MTITDELIDYLAALSRLQVPEGERAQMKTDLGSILGYMDLLGQLDTQGVEPMSHVFPIRNVLRDDVVTNGPDRDALLQNAPTAKDGCYRVPKTVD